MRHYGRVQSFFWCHPDAPALIRWALDSGRPVYAVLQEPVERCDGLYASLLPSLDFASVGELSFRARLVQLSRTRR
jgi:hypothetical protein